ncbi:MAG: hypothetical protein ABSC64_22115 [Candidatus Korobacteraceae bacterium]|jgi:hypothetical protein
MVLFQQQVTKLFAGKTWAMIPKVIMLAAWRVGVRSVVEKGTRAAGTALKRVFSGGRGIR